MKKLARPAAHPAGEDHLCALVADELGDRAWLVLWIVRVGDRQNHREGNDDYGQPRALFNLFDAGQKAQLFSNIADALQGVPWSIVERQLGHCEKVHPDYAAGVRAALAAKAAKPWAAESL